MKALNMLPIIFNQYGVPVIYSTKKEMPGWDWVRDSDYKCISIAQKDGKQGVVRNDGSVFVYNTPDFQTTA